MYDGNEVKRFILKTLKGRGTPDRVRRNFIETGKFGKFYVRFEPLQNTPPKPIITRWVIDLWPLYFAEIIGIQIARQGFNSN